MTRAQGCGVKDRSYTSDNDWSNFRASFFSTTPLERGGSRINYFTQHGQSATSLHRDQNCFERKIFPYLVIKGGNKGHLLIIGH